MQSDAITVHDFKFASPVLRCLFLIATLALLFAPCAHAGAEDAPIYLKGTVLSVDDTAALITLSLTSSAAAPPPALARFAVPKLAGRTAQDEAVLMLGSAVIADKKMAKWQVRLAPRATLAAWGVAPFKVGDDVAVVGMVANASDVLQAHYLVGNGKVTPLRAMPR